MFSAGSSNAINIITGIAATGIVIGAMSLFVVLSGFAGLKDFSLEFSSYFDPDLKLFPIQGKTFQVSAVQKEQLKKIKGVLDFSEVLEERVFLEFQRKNKNAFIKGVDENYGAIVATDSILIDGGWLNKNNTQAIIGHGISMDLSIGVGDYRNLLYLYVPKPGKGQPTDPSKAFSKESVVVTGIYNVNEDLDKKYVFTTIELARKLLKIPQNTVSNLEFVIDKKENETSIKEKISAIFKDQVVVKNSMQLNDTLYKMLNTENLAVYLIFTLVLIIALFNLVGAIIMMIIDKKQNIKTLFNLGATWQQIRAVFLFQGFLLTVLGGLLGLLLGFIIIGLQQHLQLLMITPNLPYPTKITPASFVVVFFTITVLGGIATILGSSRISKKLLSNT